LKLVYLGGHMEITVQLADPVTADVCKTLSGFFVYFPYCETGLNLPSLFDIDENAGRLSAVFDDRDAATVACAIGKVGNLLATPRRKRRRAASPPYDEGLPF
jgi:hypothetical protein